ncbi:MAG: ABC transporter permease, partial [Clostridiales Family XIII bacterium]|nr:ABC transporter permease [Clostridiales Family XIII bacterium]
MKRCVSGAGAAPDALPADRYPRISLEELLMARYIVKRLLFMIPVLFGVSLLIFTILYLTPGDPADVILGPQVSAEAREAWREKNGLNDPFFIQYFDFVGGIVLHWDWGASYVSDQSVTGEVMLRFPATFLLACLTTVIAIVIGILLGVR